MAAAEDARGRILQALHALRLNNPELGQVFDRLIAQAS